MTLAVLIYLFRTRVRIDTMCGNNDGALFAAPTRPGEILNGVEHANFFETRATEYAKAATGGAWHGNEGAWGLFDRRIARRGQLDLIPRPD